MYVASSVAMKSLRFAGPPGFFWLGLMYILSSDGEYLVPSL